MKDEGRINSIESNFLTMNLNIGYAFNIEGKDKK